MEKSPSRTSSALSPCLLWLLFFLTPITQTTRSVPPANTSLLANTTLLFDSGAPHYNLRNCSCSKPVLDCDEALANSLCSCHTVLRSDLPLAGLRDPGQLTVWVKEFWVLEELLNRSMIGHLQLSFCGTKPLPSQYLALLSLQTLRIHSSVPLVPYRNQEIKLVPAARVSVELEALSFDLASALHLTILDVAVLNGLSVLKAYSVVQPPGPSFSQHLPLRKPGEEAALQNLLLTFIY
ncbi:uncharacterized protein C21orf62 homolog [Echeneis naucrates]|uniref:uncharacterized protein C21orf62 homolog n=1 Tax=Echeneis naucrates TaxID=173247 RepID=UPI0011138CBE|nr:uncharacterized protein C21orf62 homolog [Echeneis naucrates]